MADEFKPIETQEQFDTAIKSRLERERNKYTDQLADYEKIKTQLTDAQKQIGELTSALDGANKKIAGYDSKIAERDTKIREFELRSEKMRIARDCGLSSDAVDFLQGEDEETIRRSAESLKSLVGTRPAPLAVAEPVITEASKQQAALKGMLKDLNV